MTGALQFKRYIWLLNTVYAAGRISHDEINRLWRGSSCNTDQEEVYPRKQVSRHRGYIADIFGVYIEYDKHDRCYYIENAKDITENRLQKWALNAFAVQGMLMESKALKSRLLFEEIPSGHRYLTTFIQAMQTNQVLEMSYKGFTRPEPHTFRVHPYCLKVFRLRWYMVGLSEEHEEPRIYSLDRIHALTITDDTFTMPTDFDGLAYFKDYFGTLRNTEVAPERVRIEVDAHTANYIRTLPLHHSQKEVEQTPERSVFSYYIAPTFDFIQELRTQGECLKVLQPQWLADKLRDDAAKIVQLYN